MFSVKMPSLTHEQCFDFNASLVDIKKCLKHGHRTMILMRGVTGSGKTTLARMLLEIADSINLKTAYLSSDKINPNQFTKRLRESMGDDSVLIVVDTENIERLDIKKFSELGIAERYELYVVEPETSWKYDAVNCQSKSNRNEDVESIKKKICAIKNYRPHWEQLIDTTNRSFKIKNYHQDDYSPLTPALSPAGSPTRSIILPILVDSPNKSTTSSTKMFSLAHTPKTKDVKTIGTNVTFECLAVELAGYGSTENCGYFFEKEETVRVVDKGQVRTIDRKMNANLGPDGEPLACASLLSEKEGKLAFSILTLIFPNVEHYDMRHQFQMCGTYEETFNLMLILGERTSNPSVLNDHGEQWFTLEFHESYTYLYNNDVNDEIEELAKQRDALEFDENMFETEDTMNDNAIAKVLGEQLNGNNNRELEGDAQEYIACLQQMFYHTDKEMIRRAFLASNQNLEMAREFLELQGEKKVSASARIQTFSQTVASSKSPARVSKKKTIAEEKNHFLKQIRGRQHASLAFVQAEAMKIRRQLDSERISNSSYNPVTGSQFNQIIIGDRNVRLKENMTAAVKEIDNKIRDAHSNPWNLDLHFMSVDGAVRLVSEAIEAVRYYMSTSKVMRKMYVVTGSGNNSKNGAKIKPTVEAMLKEHKIPFEPVNDGCIEIKVK